MPLDRKLRYGMVGGGPGAFIGDVHRRAIALDGLAELVCGAFSSDALKSRAFGKSLGVPRAYDHFDEMAAEEAARADGIDFAVVVTPNHVHAPAVRAFVEKGIAVICDKPFTTTLDDAHALGRLVAEKRVLFALTHNYTGYPLVKEARALVAAGKLGTVRKVVVEYSQGWLATPVERAGSKQAAWRTNPAQAGAGALGDIGSHADHLARYVTGLETERLCADVRSFVPGRPIDDDANVLLRYRGGAGGVLHCSQIAVGEENRLSLRVYGTDASLEWHQETPNALLLRTLGGEMHVLRRGQPGLSAAAAHATRLPPGHPEAFFEAFANVYGNALRTLAARLAGETPDALDLDFPTAADGARGVHFIQTALESGRQGGWVEALYTPPFA